jgi:hypothetical protein
MDRKSSRRERRDDSKRPYHYNTWSSIGTLLKCAVFYSYQFEFESFLTISIKPIEYNSKVRDRFILDKACKL